MGRNAPGNIEDRALVLLDDEYLIGLIGLIGKGCGGRVAQEKARPETRDTTGQQKKSIGLNRGHGGERASRPLPVKPWPSDDRMVDDWSGENEDQETHPPCSWVEQKNQAKDEKMGKRRPRRAVQLDAGIIASQWARETHGDRIWSRRRGEKGQDGGSLCVWRFGRW